MPRTVSGAELYMDVQVLSLIGKWKHAESAKQKVNFVFLRPAGSGSLHTPGSDVFVCQEVEEGATANKLRLI